jgi:hypothetical protein
MVVGGRRHGTITLTTSFLFLRKMFAIRTKLDVAWTHDKEIITTVRFVT